MVIDKKTRTDLKRVGQRFLMLHTNILNTLVNDIPLLIYWNSKLTLYRKEKPEIVLKIVLTLLDRKPLIAHCMNYSRTS
jgi:hypothetical protein